MTCAYIYQIIYRESKNHRFTPNCQQRCSALKLFFSPKWNSSLEDWCLTWNINTWSSWMCDCSGWSGRRSLKVFSPQHTQGLSVQMCVCTYTAPQTHTVTPEAPARNLTQKLQLRTISRSFRRIGKYIPHWWEKKNLLNKHVYLRIRCQRNLDLVLQDANVRVFTSCTQIYVTEREKYKHEEEVLPHRGKCYLGITGLCFLVHLLLTLAPWEAKHLLVTYNPQTQDFSTRGPWRLWNLRNHLVKYLVTIEIVTMYHLVKQFKVRYHFYKYLCINRYVFLNWKQTHQYVRNSH